MVTRMEFDGVPGPHGFQPDQRLSLERSLQLITRDAAWASLEENERGTVEVGKYADLTVVRENLFELPSDCLASATVLLTMVNGQIGFEGAQAYPPGAADCSSGAAPAENSAAKTPSNNEPVASDQRPSPHTEHAGGALSWALSLLICFSLILHRFNRPSSKI